MDEISKIAEEMRNATEIAELLKELKKPSQPPKQPGMDGVLDDYVADFAKSFKDPEYEERLKKPLIPLEEVKEAKERKASTRKVSEDWQGELLTGMEPESDDYLE
mmetsp:Transcript_18809/g.29384  ORF Transcript_18809/g.29384 Transcript_18809/m.29384 type:complete len:105 (+) Transcript_18809:525-839(+)